MQKIVFTWLLIKFCKVLKLHLSMARIMRTSKNINVMK